SLPDRRPAWPLAARIPCGKRLVDEEIASEARAPPHTRWSMREVRPDHDVRRITALPTEGGGGRQEPARRCQAHGRSDEPARNPRADAAPPGAFPEQASSEAGARRHGRRAFRAARTPSARLRGRTALG